MRLNLFKPLSITISAIGISLTASLGLSANALQFTNQTSFVNNLQSGFYLNNFNALTPGDQGVTNINFNTNGFSYNIADNPPSGSPAANLFAVSVNGGSQALSTSLPTDAIKISFTSGNVSAVGGNFFLTDINSNPIAGNLSINLSDGSSVNFSSTASNNYPFVGFTTTGSSFITSLDLNAVGSGQFNTIDNLYVGQSISNSVTVPWEFFPTQGILLGFTAFLGLRVLKRADDK